MNLSDMALGEENFDFGAGGSSTQAFAPITSCTPGLTALVLKCLYMCCVCSAFVYRHIRSNRRQPVNICIWGQPSYINVIVLLETVSILVSPLPCHVSLSMRLLCFLDSCLLVVATVLA